MKRIAVIGGGASGLMAAVTAAEKGADVTIIEKNDRVGKKLLATGNGKCNFSNRELHTDCYYGEYTETLPYYFKQFSVQDTIAFFEEAGMLCKEKNGYLYPYSEQASTVLDIFRLKLRELNIKTELQTAVKAVRKSKKNGLFFIERADSKDSAGSTDRLEAEGRKQGFHAVILSCGGCAAPKTGSDGSGYRLAAGFGHRVSKAVPALVQLRCREDFFKAAAGVRCEALLKLGSVSEPVQTERGELQFTDYGISGIPVFQLSRNAAYLLMRRKEVPVYIDFFPDYGKREYEDMCRGRIENRKGKDAGELLLGMANKKINLVLLKLAGIKPTEEAGKIDVRRLEELLYSYRGLRVHVTAANSFDHAQVSAGGVSMKEVSKHLESVIVPGLYLTGELLDIDGRCGGYNLQWAWTSGYIAGRKAAE